MQEQSKEDDRDTKSSKYNSFKHLNGMTHSHSSDATFTRQASDKLASL